MQKLHGGIVGRHFSSHIIVRKILDASYWWLIMNPNVYEYCQTYDQCQKINKLMIKNLTKLGTTLPQKPFQKWGFDFIGPVEPTSRLLGN